MAIKGFEEAEFQRVLYSFLSPSRPVSDVHLLRGRTKKLQQIKQALASPGRHIFIYGDRGVGKTSLAQTVATVNQPGMPSLITLSCAAPFYQVIRDLCARCRSLAALGDPAMIRVDDGPRQMTGTETPRIHSVNEAVASLKPVLPDKAVLVVLDEFDLVKTDHDKEQFADFIKQI